MQENTLFTTEAIKSVEEIIESEATGQGQLFFLEEPKSNTRTDKLLTYAINNIMDNKLVTLVGITLSKIVLTRKIETRIGCAKPEKAKKIKENLNKLKLEVANPQDVLIRKIKPSLHASDTEHLVILDVAHSSYDDRLFLTIDKLLKLHPHLTILVSLKSMHGNTELKHPILRGRNVTTITMEDLSK